MNDAPMTGLLALYLLAVLIGCWTSFRLSVVGFSGISLSFAIFLVAIVIAQSPLELGIGHAFLIWLLLPVSYVTFGIMLYRTNLHRAGSKDKLSCDIQNH